MKVRNRNHRQEDWFADPKGLINERGEILPEIRQLNRHLRKEENRETHEETRQGPKQKFLREIEA